MKLLECLNFNQVVNDGEASEQQFFYKFSKEKSGESLKNKEAKNIKHYLSFVSETS